MNLKRQCPDCGKVKQYANKYSLKKAILKNTRCRSCAKKGKRNPMYGKGYQQIGAKNPYYGNPRGFRHSESTKNKIRLAKLGRKRQREVKERIKQYWTLSKRMKQSKKMKEHNPMSGKRPWNYGKTGYSTSLKGRKHSQSSKEKMRVSRINYMNKLRGHFYPNYSIRASSIFEKLNRHGCNGVYAENGGECYIESLGYWLDFYDKENNLVIEYYERFHYKADMKLRDKERNRELKIINNIHCNFIRINAFDEEHLRVNPVRVDAKARDIVDLIVEAVK